MVFTVYQGHTIVIQMGLQLIPNVKPAQQEVSALMDVNLHVRLVTGAVEVVKRQHQPLQLI